MDNADIRDELLQVISDTGEPCLLRALEHINIQKHIDKDPENKGDGSGRILGED